MKRLGFPDARTPGLDSWVAKRAHAWADPAGQQVEPWRRARFILVQGHRLDPGITYQRYCTVRRCYVVMDRHTHRVILEIQHRIPELPLVATRLEAD